MLAIKSIYVAQHLGLGYLPLRLAKHKKGNLMKTFVLMLSTVLALPAFAAQVDLNRCKGSFMIEAGNAASQKLVEDFLAGSTKILSAKTIGSGANKVYQVRAAGPIQVESATYIMQILSQLDGVIVECDSELE
jgi:hypothetical protein